ncbi:late secretory pathway protein avl9 [Puttea exsequens]|nr:late secretory pathway protein avl9 [Puttea exsequens]
MSTDNLAPIVCVVAFHHARGPEIESWFGVEDGSDPAADNDWSFLPFMALSDGAHTSTEDFSYFTLRRKATPTNPPTSLFGISCTRQMDANQLRNRPADVTRSTVQKAVVAVADSPQSFGQLREKLSMVTGAWFAQKDFTDVDILKKFQESLAVGLRDQEDDQYLGLSLRELIHEYKHQTLVLFKCCLLQPKMLFFGSRCERLCMVQFALISLIPGLLRHLEDCADPEFDSYERNLVMPTSLKSSDRNSLLSYMGLPLQLFGKGGMFGPYTPLQQLDVLADYGTKSYIVGSTNSLLLQQKDRYSDILINLDETTVSVTSSSLRTALALSAADRRWIDFLSQTVHDTWDEQNPSRPKTMGYMGSEEFIRLQFEEYLLTLLSTTKYHLYLSSHAPLPTIEGDPITDFNPDFLHQWRQTSSFALFTTHTDSHLFDIVDPRHPTAGNLSFEDIQRRFALQIQTLHLDERLATSKEALNKHLATGHKKVSTAFSNLWADIEALREAQRKRALAQTHPQPQVSIDPSDPNFTTIDYDSSSTHPSEKSPSAPSAGNARFTARAPDLTTAQASVQAAGQKAGAYISAWGAWASERRKGWAEGRAAGASASAGAGHRASTEGIEDGGGGGGDVNADGGGGGGAVEKAGGSAGGSGRGVGGKLARWSSSASIRSLTGGGGGGGGGGGSKRKEEKGGDGIGRLDA